MSDIIMVEGKNRAAIDGRKQRKVKPAHKPPSSFTRKQARMAVAAARRALRNPNSSKKAKTARGSALTQR